MRVLMALRARGGPGEDTIKLRARLTPLHREIDLLINRYIKIAEMKVNEYSIGGILIDNSITRNISLQINNMPNNFMLYENYPNPFNPSTTIHFDLAIDGFVEIIIYNVKGEKVETLINENMPFGYHKIIWDASSYSSGMYFMKMLANEGKSSWTKKMLLVK